MGHRSEHEYQREHEHLVALLRANKGTPWHRIATIVEASGTAEGLVLGEVEPPTPLAASVVNAVSERDVHDAQIEAESWSERSNMKVWSILDDEYPARLRSVFNHPPFIFALGTWIDETDGDGLAVVGTREPTDEGLGRARMASRRLVEKGLTVLSGLAKGVDTEAHRSALDHGGRTVAVIGSGFDHIYPKENEGLLWEIVDRGCAVLSPFVPSQPPSASFTFAIRNGVMSGLSRGTIVVEAGPTSGAKMQARLALEHGRPVFLPKALVESYEWARTYAEKGHHGARAVVVTTVDDVIAALTDLSMLGDPTLDLIFDAG